jgi:hypothetical protein
MSAAYASPQQHRALGPMTHNGPPHQGGPLPPPQIPPGPGMMPQQQSMTPNGVPSGPPRAPSHPSPQANPQTIQRVCCYFIFIH